MRKRRAPTSSSRRASKPRAAVRQQMVSVVAVEHAIVAELLRFSEGGRYSGGPTISQSLAQLIAFAAIRRALTRNSRAKSRLQVDSDIEELE